MAMRGIARRARRRPKALVSRRSGRLGGPSEGVGKPCRCAASPATSLLPDGPPRRSLWVIIIETWYETLVRLSDYVGRDDCRWSALGALQHCGSLVKEF